MEDKELEGIVQRMIDAGESEDNIALVIGEYQPIKKKEISQPASQNGLEAFGLPSYTSPSNQEQDITVQESSQIGTGYVDEEESARLAEGMNPSLGEIEAQQTIDNFGSNALSGQRAKGIGQSLTSAPQPLGISDQPSWIGAGQRGMNERAREALMTYASANSYVPAVGSREGSEDYLEEGQLAESSIGAGKRRGKYFYNKFLEGVGSLLNGAVDLSIQAFSGMPQPLTELAIQQYRSEYADDVRGSVSNMVGFNMSDQDIARSDREFFTSAIGGLAQSAPAMMTGPLRMSSFFIQGYDSAINSIQSSDVNNEFSPEVKTAYAVTVGAVNAALEKVGFDRIFKARTPLLAESISNNIIKQAKDSGTKLSQDALSKSIDNSIRRLHNDYTKFGSKVLESYAVEFVTEGSQEISTKLSEYGMNALSDKDVFDTNDWSTFEGVVNDVKDVLEASAKGGIGGGIMGAIPASSQLYMDRKTRKEISDISLNNNAILNDINNIKDMDIEEAQSLMESVINNNYKIKEYLDQAESERGSLSENDQKIYDSLVDQNNRIESFKNNQELSEQSVNALDEQQDAIDSQINDLLQESPKPQRKTVDEILNEEVSPEISEKVERLAEVNSEIRDGRSDDSFEGSSREQELTLERRRLEDEINELNDNPPVTDVAAPPIEPASPVEVVAETPVSSKMETTEINAEAEAMESIANELQGKTEGELAEMYQDEVWEPSTLSTNERAIYEVLGDKFEVDRNSFVKGAGDQNNLNRSIGRSYFPRRGEKAPTVDQIAERVNTEYFNGENIVSSEDIVQYMYKYPDGSYTAVTPAGNPVLKAINEEYEAKTGKSINRRTAATIADAHRLSESQVEEIRTNDALIQEISQVMDEGGNIDFGRVEQMLENNPEALTVFPGNLNEADINNLREIIEYEKSQREQQAQAERESATESDRRIPITERQDTTNERPQQRIQQEGEVIPRQSEAVDLSGQPTLEPSQSVQVLDSENPIRAAEVLEGSLERLTEGMTDAEINADPELVALKSRIDNLKQSQESKNESIPQVEQEGAEPVSPVSERVTETEEATAVPKSLIEVLSSSEIRSARKSELSDRIRAFRESQTNLGFAYDSKQRGKEAADFTKDLIEFAAINIVDGVVATAQQFADLIGVPNTKQIKDAFNTAKATVESNDPLARTTARNIDTNAKRESFGFNERIPVTREVQSDVLAQARKEIADGYNITDLVSRINSGSGATSLETAILIEYAATAEASLIESTQKLEDRVSVAESAESWKKQVDRRAEIQSELINAYDALQASGTANAQAMSIRKAWVQRDLSLANMIIERRSASGNTRLTDSQLQEVQRQFKELREAYDAQKELLESAREDANKLAIENALLKERKVQARTRSRQNRTLTREEAREVHRKNIDSIKDKMRKLARESRGDLSSLPIKPEVIPLFAEMAKEYASIGIIDATQLVDNIYSEVQDVFDGISKRDIMDAISGYGLENDTRKTRTQLQQDMYDIRRELKLLSQIEDAKKGVKRAKPDRKDIVNQRLKDLQNELKTINQENSEATSEADTEARRIKTAKNRLQKIQEQVKSGDYKKEVKVKTEESPELKEINKKIRDTLWEIANGNAKLDLARRSKVKKVTDFVMDVTSIPRQLMSSTDLSAILRQGAFTLSRPVMSAKAFVKGAQFWWSEDAYDSWAQQVAESPGYQLMKDSGLDLTLDRMSPKMAAREELFQSKLLERMPLIGKTQSIYGVKVYGTNIIGKSDRSYTGTLNHLRVDLFERGVELLEQNGYSNLDNPEAYKALAKYVNIATGRGNFDAFGKDWANAAPVLSKFLFAPRFLLSRLQFLSGSPLYMKGTNNVIRQMYARDLAGYLGFGMTMLSLASVIGSITGDDDENDVEIGMDPNSTDFGKIKIGDTRIDVWAGSQQIATLASRMITGKYTTTTGNVTPLDGSSYNKTTRLDVLGRFARSKMSPISGLGVSALSGSNYMGERFQLGKEIGSILLPMAPMDIVENIREIDNRALAALTVPISILGGSIQTYRANDFLQKGVDDKSLDLLAKNKAMVIDPYEKPKQIYDIETGKQRFMNNAEYRKYSDVYLNKIKSELEEKHDELVNLSEEKFQGKLNGIKRKATEMATQEASGVSNSMLKISVKDKTYYLDRDQVKQRVDIQDKWISDNKETRRQFENIYINAGYDKDQAKMEANKRMLESAEKYSRGVLLRDWQDGKIELSEEKPND